MIQPRHITKLRRATQASTDAYLKASADSRQALNYSEALFEACFVTRRHRAYLCRNLCFRSRLSPTCSPSALLAGRSRVNRLTSLNSARSSTVVTGSLEYGKTTAIGPCP